MSGTDEAYYRDLLEGVYGGAKWIVAFDALASATKRAKQLLDYGASGVFAIGATRGAGELPDPSEVPQVDLGVRSDDMMSAIRDGLNVLANLPPEVVARLDQFDPQGEARAICALFSDGRPVAGRPSYGARPRSWQDLEDKTVIDDLWKKAGVEHEPFMIVDARLEDLRHAWHELGAGGDVVFSGDSAEGFNGGAQYVRWIRNEEHLEVAAGFFGAHCRKVRVMPFLDGVPCSVHGIVFDDYVAALRPCEMLVFRDPDAGRFIYASAATFWEPSSTLAREMRAVAKRVGAHLREHFGYRGTFTVDGVETPDGFRPTELNPRYGAALERMTAGLKDLAPYLLHLAICAGEDCDFRPRELEALLLDHAQRHPSGGGMQLTRREVTENIEGGLVFEGTGYRLAVGGEPTDVTYTLGPSGVGGRLRVELDPERTPRGPSAAGRVKLALESCDEHHDLDLPQVEVARAD